MEASSDLIDALKVELDEFRTAVNSFGLKPLPGETCEMASMQLSTATKSVASTVEVNFDGFLGLFDDSQMRTRNFSLYFFSFSQIQITFIRIWILIFFLDIAIN